MAAKFYPVGIQTFSEIITKNYLYVDKTGYIHQMTHSQEISFSESPSSIRKVASCLYLAKLLRRKEGTFQGIGDGKAGTGLGGIPCLAF